MLTHTVELKTNTFSILAFQESTILIAICPPQQNGCVRFLLYPPTSKARREVANLTERKNPHTPFMVSKNLFIPTQIAKFITIHEINFW